MVTQFPAEQEAKIEYKFDVNFGDGSDDTFYDSVAGIDILDISPDTSARITHHIGESGQVHTDTRVRQPARYRATLVVPEYGIGPELGRTERGMEREVLNLLDASAPDPVLYRVTSLYTQCHDMMVVSSREKNTNDMRNLRIQEVVFEEVMVVDEDLEGNNNVKSEECAEAEDGDSVEMPDTYFVDDNFEEEAEIFDEGPEASVDIVKEFA